MLGDVRVQLRDVEAVGRVDAARDVRHPEHRRAAHVQLGRRDAADVAEALDDAALLADLLAEALARALERT